MKNKYWAKQKYSQVDPVDYEIIRFSTNAGKLIDEVEKEAVLDFLVTHKYSKNKLNILDVATGPGRLAFFLEKSLPSVSITGVDINRNMIGGARKTGLVQKSRVKFIQADLYHLPFQNNQFDVVAGLRFSMHLPQLSPVLEEFHRILKAGGILIFDIFNDRSIFKLKIPAGGRRNHLGFYTIRDVIKKAHNYKLEFLGKKGILLFGETMIRRFPDGLLPSVFPLVRPPFFLQDFSTKIVLCFRKL